MDKGYFDEDDDEDDSTVHRSVIDDDEVDPLDAFMAGVQDEVKIQGSMPKPKEVSLPEIVSGQDDYSTYEDMVNVQLTEAGDDTAFDSDGIPVDGEDKKSVAPLPPIDHSLIKYASFRRNFYQKHSAVASLSFSDAAAIMRDLDVSIQGCLDAVPITEFKFAGFPVELTREISRVGYEKPTSIQSATLPISLGGHDLLALAKTGSGKTMSFVWPMLIHILDQPNMEIGDGPIGLVMAPTRELAAQIYAETKKFAKVYQIRVCAVFGGGGKWEMKKALKESPEVVIATPGRLIELLGANGGSCTNLKRCTYVVLDEADRMFDMGFEYQIRSILANIRKDRQTLLFSATMKKKVEVFAREILTNPVRVVVGQIGQANPDIQQSVVVCRNDAEKWTWLEKLLDTAAQAHIVGGEVGKVLIFVSSKAGTEELSKNLRKHFVSSSSIYIGGNTVTSGVECLHGDMHQSSRDDAMRRYKNGSSVVLVATDVASRGLDVKNIRTVINFDVPKNIETYVHRIGRTGRLGVEGCSPGVAYTLLTSQNASFAGDLVRNLNISRQPVSSELIKLADSDPHYRQRQQSRGGSGVNVREGLGMLGATGEKKVAMTSEMLANDHKPSSSYSKPSKPSRFAPAPHSAHPNPTQTSLPKSMGNFVKASVAAPVSFSSSSVSSSVNSASSSVNSVGGTDINSHRFSASKASGEVSTKNNRFSAAGSTFSAAGTGVSSRFGAVGASKYKATVPANKPVHSAGDPCAGVGDNSSAPVKKKSRWDC